MVCAAGEDDVSDDYDQERPRASSGDSDAGFSYGSVIFGVVVATALVWLWNRSEHAQRLEQKLRTASPAVVEKCRARCDSEHVYSKEKRDVCYDDCRTYW